MEKLLIEVFERMVGFKRPFGSRDEGMVIPYLMTLVPDSGVVWIDGSGNLHVDMRGDTAAATLFVAHTDTVHHDDGFNSYTVDEAGVYHASGNPLGADDGAGIAILACLMQSVPAYYIFTRGEECGGIGAKFLASEHAELLRDFDRAIAFDRRGTSDVITHQGRGRCCSDAFGEALSDALNDQGMLYMPSDKGVYTDTAEFIYDIPECTNISVGYQREHTQYECQDSKHLIDLMSAALYLDWESLPCERRCSVPISRWARYTSPEPLVRTGFDNVLDSLDDLEEDEDEDTWLREDARDALLKKYGITTFDMKMETIEDTDESDPFHVGKCH